MYTGYINLEEHRHQVLSLGYPYLTSLSEIDILDFFLSFYLFCLLVVKERGVLVFVGEERHAVY